MKSKILIIDDDSAFSNTLKRLLEAQRYEVDCASGGPEALRQIKKEKPHLILLDFYLPQMSGLELLKEIFELYPKQRVMVITGEGSTEIAIDAMRKGAFDYMLKNFEPDDLLKQIEKALLSDRFMNAEVSLPGDHIEFSFKNDPSEPVKQIVGLSPRMQQIYKTIGQIAASNVNVLILGENGTGKELIAQAIYRHSHRVLNPFMALNCAAIPESLLESELFGYEKGSFTGAEEKRIGKLEQIHGGTLFLDEIGDMPLLTQSKLLRVLQEKKFQRVGGSESIHVDVRVIAATNRDLKELILKKQFREDLYYRLNVVSIDLPPLRERSEDIPALVEYFVAQANVEFGRKVQSVSRQAMQDLMQHPWPGNVRELENCIRKSVLFSSSPVLDSHLLLAKAKDSEQQKVPLEMQEKIEKDLKNLFDQVALLPDHNSYRQGLLRKMEDFLIPLALNYFKGNQVKTAQFLGITRNTLRSRIKAD